MYIHLSNQVTLGCCHVNEKPGICNCGRQSEEAVFPGRFSLGDARFSASYTCIKVSYLV